MTSKIKPADTPRRPRVSLTTFVEYLTAGSSGRIDCVQRQRAVYEAAYVPAGDFYADIIRAMQDGRRAGDDELAVRRAIAKQQDDTRRTHYETIATAWLAWLSTQPRMKPLHVGRAIWATAALDVGISPQFAVQLPDGSERVIVLWLKASELTSDAVKATLRLLDRHMPELRPDATASVLDVRRRHLYLPSRRRLRKDYDGWLEAEALGFAHLWQAVGRQSA